MGRVGARGLAHHVWPVPERPGLQLPRRRHLCPNALLIPAPMTLRGGRARPRTAVRVGVGRAQGARPRSRCQRPPPPDHRPGRAGPRGCRSRGSVPESPERRRRRSRDPCPRSRRRARTATGGGDQGSPGCDAALREPIAYWVLRTSIEGVDRRQAVTPCSGLDPDVASGPSVGGADAESVGGSES